MSSFFLREQSERIFISALETVVAGYLLGQGTDQTLPVDRLAKMLLNLSQQDGNVEGGTGLLEYGICHVNLRQTSFMGRSFNRFFTTAESFNGAQLSFQSGFKSFKESVAKGVLHDSSGIGRLIWRIAETGRSVNK
jgi:hypothetical protein